MFKKKIAALLLTLLIYAPFASSNEVALNPDHPQQYVVVKGDTLWDISARFLRDPWLWPEVWHVNQQIANPHLIFPGDLISLVYIDGRPRLQVTRGAGGDEKLSPRIREMDLDQAIPAIPLNAINQFLSRPRLVDDETLQKAPYIASIVDRRVMAGIGDKIYVRGFEGQIGQSWVMVRKGDAYIDPDTGELLGYEAIYLGDARVNSAGETSILTVTKSEKEALMADRLLPSEDRTIVTSYQPHPPKQTIDGKIIAVFNGVQYIGQYNIVAINRGTNHGLDEGTVLAIYQKGATVPDPVNKGQKITLPDERAGEMMVFRTHEKMSYALILRAFKEMQVLDLVRNP
jgi:hypothetical protein